MTLKQLACEEVFYFLHEGKITVRMRIPHNPVRKLITISCILFVVHRIKSWSSPQDGIEAVEFQSVVEPKWIETAVRQLSVQASVPWYERLSLSRRSWWS